MKEVGDINNDALLPEDLVYQRGDSELLRQSIMKNPVKLFTYYKRGADNCRQLFEYLLSHLPNIKPGNIINIDGGEYIFVYQKVEMDNRSTK